MAVARGLRYTAAVGARVATVIVLVSLATAGNLAWQDEVRPPFEDWLQALRVEAIDRGISPDVVERALGNLAEPLPVVLERDRNQAEAVLPLETYIAQRVTASVVRTGRQMRDRHRVLLDRVSAAYGVPAEVIVAIWGLESNFGRFTGTRPTIASLATLAWDPRRATLFRRELFNALEIVDRGDIELAGLRGSWAGAMGQPQFMPSSYLQYAVDFDEDGRRDIWLSHADIFASVANYLKGYGWTTGYRWGRDVIVSTDVALSVGDLPRREGSCSARRDMTVRLPLDEWRRLGIRETGGNALPDAQIEASLVSATSRHFLVYDNYDVLLAYNCAHAYALSVGLLAQRIG